MKNNGEESLTLAKQKMGIVEKALDEYENACGLPHNNNPGNTTEIEGYLNMSRDMIEKLNPQDCTQIAYRLSLLGFHLQRCINRETARISWASTELKKIVAKESGNFDKFTKHEVKVELIQLNNSYANSLGRIINYAEQRVARLEFLTSSIKNLADIMLANYRSKSYGTSRPT